MPTKTVTTTSESLVQGKILKTQRKSSSAFTCLMYEEILQKRMLDRVLQKMLFIHAMACRMSGNKLVLDVLVLLL